MRIKWLSILIFLKMILACSKADDDKKSASKPPAVASVGELKDTSVEGIISFLKAGDYKTWAAEAAVHDSSGPHGKVKSFYNAALAESLATANNATHPVGSLTVKELYESDASSLKGYALSAKTSEGADGDSWLWYEGLTPKFNQYHGQGLSSCTGCHSDGFDYVISKP